VFQYTYQHIHGREVSESGNVLQMLLFFENRRPENLGICMVCVHFKGRCVFLFVFFVVVVVVYNNFAYMNAWIQ